jgi:hypothetical protein
LLPEQYRILIERVGHFRTNREFDLNPLDVDTLRLLGAPYFITSESVPAYASLSASPRFHLLQPDDSYYKVFALNDPQAAFAWEGHGAGNTVELKGWLAEKRAFTVSSESGGRFRLTEQFYPGWKATVDGIETTIERCHEAFQCIAVQPGSHVVEFRFQSRFLGAGAVISLCSLLLLVYCVRARPMAPAVSY